MKTRTVITGSVLAIATAVIIGGSIMLANTDSGLAGNYIATTTGEGEGVGETNSVVVTDCGIGSDCVVVKMIYDETPDEPAGFREDKYHFNGTQGVTEKKSEDITCLKGSANEHQTPQTYWTIEATFDRGSVFSDGWDCGWGHQTMGPGSFDPERVG